VLDLRLGWTRSRNFCVCRTKWLILYVRSFHVCRKMKMYIQDSCQQHVYVSYIWGILQNISLKCVQCQEIPFQPIHLLGLFEFLYYCFTFNCKVAPVLKHQVMEAYRRLWSYSSFGTWWSEWLFIQSIYVHPLIDSPGTHCIGYWGVLSTVERKVFLLTRTIYSVSCHFINLL
jgi:hypothetical protein